ncbi:hypothetical protein BH11ARM2_BH11ARM2_09450 [soil metagenome]
MDSLEEDDYQPTPQNNDDRALYESFRRTGTLPG